MNKKNLKKFIFLIVFLNLSLLVVYLFQIEGLIRENYLVQSYKQKIGDLKEQSSRLEQETRESLSLENMEKEIKILGFVEISKIKYIPISYDYLAKVINY